MPSARCRRGCSSASSDWLRLRRRRAESCLALRVTLEEAQELRVLAEEVLDLGDPCPGPVLDPGLGEVVLDAMAAAFAHAGMIDPNPDDGYGPIGSTCRARGPRQNPLVPRASATAHELNRIGLFATLPGETLRRLAQAMEREEVAPGTVIVNEGDPGDRFYVVF